MLARALLARRCLPEIALMRPLTMGVRWFHLPSLHTSSCRLQANPRIFECLRISRRSAFNVGSSLFRGEKESDSMRVVLLSGFLGAGKTTVLEQLLREEHGYKLGVIVNDLASVNVDANVLRKSIDSAGVKSVSLENGCVCCTATDDLKESVQKLVQDSASADLDAVVVELSGVAEPIRVKQILEQETKPSLLKSLDQTLAVRTITVVDTPAFASDYMGEHSEHPHKHVSESEPEECDHRFGTLLAEQVESADLILLNKVDMASEQDLRQTQAMVGSLNDVAETHVTQYGKVSVERLLDIEPGKYVKEADSATNGTQSATEKPVSSCCVAKTCSSSNPTSTSTCASRSDNSAATRAETRFGITSFVYRTDRMMSRVKLVKELGEWQKARAAKGDKLNLEGLNAHSQSVSSVEHIGSPMAPILRSKGILLLDANPDVAFYWSHAGKSVNFSVFGPWLESVKQVDGGVGAPRTEIVFIGSGYDEHKITQLLDSCLMSEEEITFFKKMRPGKWQGGGV